MRSSHQSTFAFRVLAGLSALMAGCFGQPTIRYEMLPVTGRVTMQGQPLVQAEVRLDSHNGPRGFGLTDAAGGFTIATRQYGSGLPAGTYRVFIVGSDKTRLGTSPVPVAVPVVYRETGVGEVTIGPGGGPLSFDLKSKSEGLKAESGDASDR